MTGADTLMARAAVGVAGSLASLVLVSLRRLRTIPEAFFDRLAVGGLIASRAALFVLAFLLLHLPVRGDIAGAYWDEARAALHGGLPYRNFTSSYAPLHAFLDLALIKLWYTPLAIVALSIVAEWLLLPVWLRVGRQLFVEQDVRTAALLYLASPLSLVFVTVDGQDNVIIALMMAVALVLLLRNRALASGLATGVAMSVIKILPLLFTPIFFFALPRRWSWAAGVLLPVVVVYGSAVALHLPILQPLSYESSLRTAGNIPYLVEMSTGHVFPSRLWDSLVLVALIAIPLYVARVVRGQSLRTRLLAITFAMPAIILALDFLSKKGWPNYLMLVLFPFCLLARRMGRGALVAFCFFAAVGVVEHSYWASLLHEASAPIVHHLLVASPHEPLARILVLWGFVLIELLLLGAYCWLVALALRAVARAPQHPALAGDSAGQRGLQGA